MSHQNENEDKSQALKGEESLLLDHNYDGIQELDHPLPRWWVSLFYLTIVFAAGYVSYYMTGIGPSLREELATSLAEIEARKPAPQPGGDGLSDEALIALAAQPEKVANGKDVFAGKCAACHGDKGQGIIGPNLTDDHWLHGTGKPSEVAAIVRDGVVEKGMPPWGPVLTPDELKNVTAYIRSIHGTKPAGAKEPQGNLHATNE